MPDSGRRPQTRLGGFAADRWCVQDSTICPAGPRANQCATYDARGQRLSLRNGPGSDLTQFRYDPLGRMTAVQDAQTGSIGYAYNGRGERTALTYPDGTAVQYGYRLDGQLQSVTSAGSTLASYGYDPVGRVASVARANGATTTYGYDAADRLTTLATAGSAGEVSRFTYALDQLGLRTVVTETIGSAITATGVITRINVAGPSQTTSGVVWGADQPGYWVGGESKQNTDVNLAINGTVDDAIYREYRSATSADGQFTFSLPVPNGTYTVKLHFAEVYWGATGGLISTSCTTTACSNRRKFDVNIEGGSVELDNYDINADVGPMTAVVKTFSATISDGQLSILFDARTASGGIDRPLIAAIEVQPNGGTAQQGSPSGKVGLMQFDPAVGIAGTAAFSDTARRVRPTVPLQFVPNAGRTQGRVAYTAQSAAGPLFFTPDGVVLALPTATTTTTLRQRPFRLLRLQYEGSSATTVITAGIPLAGTANFLLGSDSRAWKRSVPTYADIQYQGLYPGIDLTFSGDDGQLKSAYVIAPGANPQQIGWRYQGAQNVAVDAAGNLVITVVSRVISGTERLTTTQEVVERAPIAWQELDGRRVVVTVGYTVAANGRVRFQLGTYDTSEPVIIDPTIVYAMGSGTASDLVVDGAGNVYALELALAAPISTTFGITTTTGSLDVVVTKLAPDGTPLFTTYLGGSDQDFGQALAIDSTGSIYLTGATASPDFPLVSSIEGYNGTSSSGFADDRDVFIAKLNATGTVLKYSTYVGGTMLDQGWDIAVDGAGNAYVAGQTQSQNFNTQAAVDPLLNDDGGTIGQDGFVLKLSATGALGYSTYLGGSDDDEASGIAVDAAGAAVVIGRTRTYDGTFPTTANAIQRLPGGGDDLFVTKFTTAGSVVYSTYLGGSGYEQPGCYLGWVDVTYTSSGGIALDSASNAYIVGGTTSSNWVTTTGSLAPTLHGGRDGVLVTLSPSGARLRSTFLGGSNGDSICDVAVAVAADTTLALTGYTASSDFPLRDAVDVTWNGGVDPFVTTVLSGGVALGWSSYLGTSSEDDYGEAVGIDGTGAVYVATTGRGITKLSSRMGVQSSTRATTSTYDRLQRLIGAREQPGTVYSSTYDLAGNRLQTRENGILTHDEVYDAANQVVRDDVTYATWTYDPAGNRLRNNQTFYQYDALSRLITATLGVQQRAYAYTGDGLLHAQGANGATTRYAQDLALPLPQVLATTGATTATFRYGADRLATVQGGTRTWEVPDALGSVRLRLDDAATPLQALRYDPWGVPQLGPQPQPWGFTGELHDPQFGLVNLRARWYDTNSGTFLTKDPYPGVPTRPFSQHPYAYALANPVNYTDPLGKCVPGLDIECEFIGLERVARFDLNWGDGREYWQNVDQLVQDAIVGPVDLLYNAATDAESQGTIVRGAQRLWSDKLGSAAIVGNAAIKPFTDIYNGIVCGDSVQLGRGLTGYALSLSSARYFRSPTPRPQLGQLRNIGPSWWKSTSGLRYGPQPSSPSSPSFTNRVQHVLGHTVDDLTRSTHGVFDAGRAGTLAVVDEAWNIAKQGGTRVNVIPQGTRTVYIVDMGRRVGYVGGQGGAAAGYPAASHVLLVVENGADVITAFPSIPIPPVPVMP